MVKVKVNMDLYSALS